jgi:hypothetical protein
MSITITGIAGTAKNTGKTTTLNALLHHSHAHNIPIGVTSIGYDGEEIDNITALPKPRIFLHHGMVASTSLSCVPTSGWNILQRTGIVTALGEIVIIRCEMPGFIVLAGPNKRSELKKVVREMADLGCDEIFVDGSLNRIAPMSVVDNIIFTTGAARTTDITALVEEMKAIEFFFQFGKSQRLDKETQSPINVILNTFASLSVNSAKNAVSVRGFITSTELRTLVEKIQQMPDDDWPHEIMFTDPITLLLSGEPKITVQILLELIQMNRTISYRKAVQLSAITVNPFYPEYQGTIYTPAYVDKILLLTEMRRTLKTPSFNIADDGILDTWNAIYKNGCHKNG